MASLAANLNQKMNAIRLEADENQAKAEELQAKVKTLEQENLQKEQEITSLTHRNQLLESEVEKLETGIKEAKSAAGESAQHGQQNETLTRRLQLLEEEAEEADKTLRETNEKYVQLSHQPGLPLILLPTDFARQMSRPVITNAKFRPSSKHGTSGRPSTKRWPRSTQIYKRNCKSWKSVWAISKWSAVCAEGKLKVYAPSQR